MPIKNSTEAYGAIAKTLHWVTVLLFAISYCSIYYREWLAESDFENWSATQLHFSVGISIFVVTILRFIWRLTNQKPKPEPGSKFQHSVARIGHYSLYTILIIMPICGYLSIADYLSSGRGRVMFFLLFNMPSFQDVQIFESLGVTLKQLEDPADLIHSFLGTWVTWLLVLGHALAAFYHHFILKDKTLIKMMLRK